MKRLKVGLWPMVDINKLILSALCLVCLIGVFIVHENDYQQVRVVQEIENPRLKGLLSNALTKTNNKMVIVQNEY